MNTKNKVLAESSIFAFLAVGGGSLSLALAYSGELFTLFPVLLSIGLSIPGLVLIASTVLFLSLSFVLSRFFLKSKNLEKENSKEEAEEREVLKTKPSLEVEKKNTKEDLEQHHITKEKTKEETEILRRLNYDKKIRHFVSAIGDFNKRSIKMIVKKVLSKPKNFKEKNLKEEAKKQALLKTKSSVEQEDTEEDLETYHVTKEDMKDERKILRSLSPDEKIRYFVNAIGDFDKPSIATIVVKKHKFKEIIPKYGDFIYYAAKKGGDKVVKYIKSLGVNINEPFGDSEYPPMLCVIACNNTEVLRCLINNGADPNILLGSMTPLTMAARYLQIEQVEFLLSIKEVRQKINATSPAGNTPLMKVLKKKCEDSSKRLQYDIIKLLLKNGADPTIENQCKKTALDIAKENNCGTEVISLLEVVTKWKEESKEKLKERYTDKLAKSKKSQFYYK